MTPLEPLVPARASPLTRDQMCEKVCGAASAAIMQHGLRYHKRAPRPARACARRGRARARASSSPIGVRWSAGHATSGRSNGTAGVVRASTSSRVMTQSPARRSEVDEIRPKSAGLNPARQRAVAAPRTGRRRRRARPAQKGITQKQSPPPRRGEVSPWNPILPDAGLRGGGQGPGGGGAI